MEERHLIKQWMDSVLAATGWSAAKWADAAKTSATNISRLRKDPDGAPVPGPRTLAKLARAVPKEHHLPLPDLGGSGEAPAAHPASDVMENLAATDAGTFVPRIVEVPAAGTMPIGVPVYGTAVGGEDADFEMNGEVIDRVRRPPGLADVRNAFALYVVGDSMSPRYDPGGLIYIHPGKPAAPGCDVVVEFKATDEFGRHKALLKTYRGKTPTKLLLSQFNPVRDIEIPLEHVKQVLRVMRLEELLGI